MCPHNADPCPICAALEREGRALADLLDGGEIDPKIRAELLSAKSAGSWSAEARAVVARCS